MDRNAERRLAKADYGRAWHRASDLAAGSPTASLPQLWRPTLVWSPVFWRLLEFPSFRLKGLHKERCGKAPGLRGAPSNETAADDAGANAIWKSADRPSTARVASGPCRSRQGCDPCMKLRPQKPAIHLPFCFSPKGAEANHQAPVRV